MDEEEETAAVISQYSDSDREFGQTELKRKRRTKSYESMKVSQKPTASSCGVVPTKSSSCSNLTSPRKTPLELKKKPFVQMVSPLRRFTSTTTKRAKVEDRSTLTARNTQHGDRMESAIGSVRNHMSRTERLTRLEDAFPRTIDQNGEVVVLSETWLDKDYITTIEALLAAHHLLSREEGSPIQVLSTFLPSHNCTGEKVTNLDHLFGVDKMDLITSMWTSYQKRYAVVRSETDAYSRDKELSGDTVPIPRPTTTPTVGIGGRGGGDVVASGGTAGRGEISSVSYTSSYVMGLEIENVRLVKELAARDQLIQWLQEEFANEKKVLEGEILARNRECQTMRVTFQTQQMLIGSKLNAITSTLKSDAIRGLDDIVRLMTRTGSPVLLLPAAARSSTGVRGAGGEQGGDGAQSNILLKEPRHRLLPPRPSGSPIDDSNLSSSASNKPMDPTGLPLDRVSPLDYPYGRPSNTQLTKHADWTCPDANITLVSSDWLLFPVNKEVLTAHSPVLSALLSLPSYDNHYLMGDVAGEVLYLLLLLTFGGQPGGVPDWLDCTYGLNKVFEDVRRAAERYKLTDTIRLSCDQFGAQLAQLTAPMQVPTALQVAYTFEARKFLLHLHLQFLDRQYLNDAPVGEILRVNGMVNEMPQMADEQPDQVVAELLYALSDHIVEVRQLLDSCASEKQALEVELASAEARLAALTLPPTRAGSPDSHVDSTDESEHEADE